MLEQYLHNELSPEERTTMDQRLTDDASLQQKLSVVRLLLLGVQEAALQEKLQAFHEELHRTEKNHRIGRSPLSIRTLLVAASVLLVVCASAWLLLLRGSSKERLFADYFKPDPGLITAMSATDNYAFEKAMIDYKKREYAAAIATWDSLQKLQPANDTLNYFLGVAHLANGNSTEAISYLEKVTATTAFFTADAHWYLALALVKEGKKEAAMKALEKASHPKKESLLQELQKR